MTDVASASLDAAQNAILSDDTTYYMGLNTADPGQTGADEDTSLTRQEITFNASSGGTQTSSNDQSFSIGDDDTYTNFSIWTAATDGTYLRGGSLTSSLNPGSGGTITFASGAVTFTAS